MSKVSILQNFKSSDLKSDPYHYFSLENALPAKLYEHMQADYPKLDTFYKYSHRTDEQQLKQNAFYKLHANKAIENPQMLSGAWNDYVAYHTSQEFFDEAINKLGNAIEKTYPGLLSKMSKKSETGKPTTSIRNAEPVTRQTAAALDCMVGINSPVTQEGTRVIRAHLDNPKMLFAGLFYLRMPEDTSTGGDFLIYEWKNPESPKYIERREIAEDQVRLRDVVPYRANSFVWFLNSFGAVHGVSVRSPTPTPRRLCEVVADADPTVNRLYELTGKPVRTTLKDVIRNLKKLARAA
jgi:hypothetical protein